MAVSRSVAAVFGAAGIAFCALTGSAVAEDKFAWSATLTGTSDYVFRGISQTDNDPTIQGSIGATYGMFYAGAWGSGLDWNGLFGDPNAQIEIDWYGGIKPTWGKATFDFGVIYYTYPGSTGSDSNALLELKAGVSGEILPKLTAGATYYYSPDYRNFEYGVFEGTLAYALPKFLMFDPTVSGLYGNQQGFDNVTLDYSYWNAGLTLTVEKLAFDFRYWDTDLSGSCPGNRSFCDERFVFSATLSLP
jgi:uncharacterized protein (TIGR02001 family)